MMYGLNYRNMSTAVHGILLFHSRVQAKLHIKHLQNTEDKDQVYDNLVKAIFDIADGQIPEIDHRKIRTHMYNTDFFKYSFGKLERANENITVVNPEVAVDLYL